MFYHALKPVFCSLRCRRVIAGPCARSVQNLAGAHKQTYVFTGNFERTRRIYMTSTSDKIDDDNLRKVWKSKKRKKASPPISTLTEEMARTELMELNRMINYHDSLYYTSLENDKMEILVQSGSVLQAQKLRLLVTVHTTSW